MWTALLLALRGIWAAIPRGLKIGALAAVAALLALWGSYTLGKHAARQEAAVSAAKAVAKAYKDRSDENTTVDALDRVQLCVALGGRLSDCRAELRRMGEDHSPAGDGGLSRRP